MDKYLQLPPLVNATSRDLENEAWQKRDYKLLISHNATCSPLHHDRRESRTLGFDFDNDVFLLITIKSTCSHESRRKAIRSSWGNVNWIFEHLSVRVKIVFALGRCDTKEESLNLLIESELHEDIIQWDFVDNFRNLTLKQFLQWQWYATHCMDVPFLFQGDDDVFVNIVKIVSLLLSTPVGLEQNLWTGSVLRNGSPIRVNTSRYYVSKSLYPRTHYAPYVSGGGYLISGYLVVRVFLQTLKARIIQVDDAFLGILSEAVGVEPIIGNHIFATWGLNDPNGKDISKVVTYHKALPFPMMAMWLDLLDYYSESEGEGT